MKNLLQATKETLKNFYRSQFQKCQQAPIKNPYLKVELQTLCRQLAGLRKKRRITAELLVNKLKEIAQTNVDQLICDYPCRANRAARLYYSLLCYKMLIRELEIRIINLARGAKQ